jgi:hypothetical protein
VQSISTNYANELIVGWSASFSGLSITAPAGAPYTFDQSIPAITLDGTESDTVSSKGTFQSNFTGQNAFAWATGVIGLVSPSDATFSISGNAGVAGATVSYSGASSGSVTADGSGNFTISELTNGNYVITPSFPNFSFSPLSANITISGANITGVNFTATVLALSQYSYTMLADIIANEIFPDAYRLQAAITFLLKNKGGNTNPTVLDGVLIVPDGGEAQYASLISQYEKSSLSFAGYLARASQILGL